MRAASLAEPPSEPFSLFQAWYAEAEGCEQIKYAAAMCLSTVDPEGLPDARVVLLESLDTGFVFFTDLESAKARALDRLPEAALTFYWGPLDRQVRIRGRVERTPDQVADECFRRRPRGSQVTTWASRQSRVLDDPKELAGRYEEAVVKLEGIDPVPRPATWGAYRLLPREIELWAAKTHRLHHRLLYIRSQSGGWTARRLYP